MHEAHVTVTVAVHASLTTKSAILVEKPVRIWPIHNQYFMWHRGTKLCNNTQNADEAMSYLRP